MFKVTQDWLHNYYGSKNEEQYAQCKAWLQRFGKDVPEDKLDDWARWKHLSEYQTNTNDIVERCLAMVGQEYRSQLEAHKLINLMRVPIAKYYIAALDEVKPKTILELGVGGDSAISTAIFLSFLEEQGEAVKMISVDYNPLGSTWVRYCKVPFWEFLQEDSINVLNRFMGRWFDMVFIDTIHSYEQTKREMELASLITDNILMDDIHFTGNEFDKLPGGVKRAWEEWQEKETDWDAKTFDTGKIGLLTRENGKAREVSKTVARERPRPTRLSLSVSGYKGPIPQFKGTGEVDKKPRKKDTKTRKKKSTTSKSPARRKGGSRKGEKRTKTEKGTTDKDKKRVGSSKTGTKGSRRKLD